VNMSTSRPLQLLQRLLDRTRAGEIQWRDAGGGVADRFVFGLKSGSVTVEEQPFMGPSVRIMDKHGNEIFSHGAVLTASTATSDPEMSIVVQRLYETVRESVRRPDALMDDLLRELEAE